MASPPDRALHRAGPCATPGRPPHATAGDAGRAAKAKPFFRNERLSEGRLHDTPIVQRATAALGAEAMTVGTHIFRQVADHATDHVADAGPSVRRSTDGGGGTATVQRAGGRERGAAEEETRRMAPTSG
ncbi:eCIS core domain-containing protein [Streptomyces sp. NPDC059459]|uniref:eCIS core domain-containing protein n=1 Tax=unclassified Streptomyces TaxID=2593676 RepID=UPI0036741219